MRIGFSRRRRRKRCSSRNVPDDVIIMDAARPSRLFVCRFVVRHDVFVFVFYSYVYLRARASTAVAETRDERARGLKINSPRTACSRSKFIMSSRRWRRRVPTFCNTRFGSVAEQRERYTAAAAAAAETAGRKGNGCEISHAAAIRIRQKPWLVRRVIFFFSTARRPHVCSRRRRRQYVKKRSAADRVDRQNIIRVLVTRDSGALEFSVFVVHTRNAVNVRHVLSYRSIDSSALTHLKTDSNSSWLSNI